MICLGDVSKEILEKMLKVWENMKFFPQHWGNFGLLGETSKSKFFPSAGGKEFYLDLGWIALWGCS